MKILPGTTCPDGLAKLARGEPYFLSSFPGQGRPFRYSCAACQKRTRAGAPVEGGEHEITAAQFWALPEATRDQLKRWLPGLEGAP